MSKYLSFKSSWEAEAMEESAKLKCLLDCSDICLMFVVRMMTGGCPSSLAPYIDVTAPWLANGPNMMTCAGMPIVNLWK